SCPKCARPGDPDEISCSRCGLLRARWAAYDARPAPHPMLDPLWERAREDWQDDRRHRALAAVVTTHWAALAALSQRYPRVLRQQPDDTVAKAALDRLIQLALMLPAPTGAEGTRLLARALRGAVGLMLFFAALGLLLSLWRRLG